MLCAGTWSARVSAHAGLEGAALLVPLTGRPPAAGELAAVLESVGRLGFDRVVVQTGEGADEAPFRALGFEVVDRLHLLTHDLADLATAPGAPLRRAHRREATALLEIDHAAFEPFWHLDEDGLVAARRATPSHRLRVADGGGVPVAYAVTGRAGDQAYVQRLAVHPSAWGQGLGSALLLDGLHWARARGARRALVNTQVGNARARALYLRHGFRLAPAGIAVLARRLGDER